MNAAIANDLAVCPDDNELRRGTVYLTGANERLVAAVELVGA